MKLSTVFLLASSTLVGAAKSYLRLSRGSQDAGAADQQNERLLETVSYSNYYSGYCRINSDGSGEGSSPDYYELYSSGETLDSCQEKCTLSSDCKGFEYGNGRCELWTVTPLGWLDSSEYNCYLKEVVTSSNYNDCKEVHRRPIYGTGDGPMTISKDEEYKYLASHYEPFGAYVPDKKNGSVRKWRMYAIYNDGGKVTDSSGIDSYISFKFDWSNNSSFTFDMPTIGGHDSDYRGEGYSKWYEADRNDYDAKVYVQLYTNDQYNLYGKVYWVEIIAYDCYYASN